MRTNNLLDTTAPAALIAHRMGVQMTPSERRYGRMMRAPEGHDDNGGGGDQNQGGGDNNDNGDGGNNNDQNPNRNDDGNNNDGSPDLASFWNTDDSNTNNDGNQPPEFDAAKVFGEATAAIKPAVTQEMMAAVADGNVDGFNKHLGELLTQSVRSAIQVIIPAMQKFEYDITSKHKSEVDGRFNQTRQDQLLSKEIPAVADKAQGPIIRNIFAQALKNTKGNESEAIKLTKDMMRATGMSANLRNAPDDAAGGGTGTAPKDWLKSLMTA